MAVLVLIMGDSGTGKSTSFRTFEPGQASVFNVANKPLPFKRKNRSDIALVDIKGYEDLLSKLREAQRDSLIIDDAQYLMAFEFFNTMNEKGYEKFAKMGQHFYRVIDQARRLKNHKIVYFIMHIDRSEDGYEKAKVLGRMLDDKLSFEGLFTICLKTVVKDEVGQSREYLFSTQNSGFDRVKTPLGMFESDYIPNDLKMVDDQIRDYYGIERPIDGAVEKE